MPTSVSQQIQPYRSQIIFTALVSSRVSNAVPRHFTKLQCGMLNPSHGALPFGIKTGLEIPPLTGKAARIKLRGKPPTGLLLPLLSKKLLNAAALPSSVHSQHCTLPKGPNATRKAGRKASSLIFVPLVTTKEVQKV